MLAFAVPACVLVQVLDRQWKANHGGDELGQQQDRSGAKRRAPDLDQERLEYEVAQEIGVDPAKARQARNRRKGGKAGDQPAGNRG